MLWSLRERELLIMSVSSIQNAHNPELFHSRSVLRPLTNKEQMQRANAMCVSKPATGLSCSGQIFVGTLMMFILTLTACSEKMMPAGITGYNHTKDRSIFNFTVNDAMGSNLAPESGGGAESCCVMIPEKWRPGLKVTVDWGYQGGTEIPPPPPPQVKVVEIPEYKHGGRLEVHFYDNHQVKIIVSPCGIEHPFYPMSNKDKLPWVASGTKQDSIDSHNRGGDIIDCN